MAALKKPDMFIVAGDFVNCEGEISNESATRWARYLDYLYGVDDGYFSMISKLMARSTITWSFLTSESWEIMK